MTRLTALVLVAFTACSGAANDSFYLRFDPHLGPDAPLFIGEFRVCLFKDRIFSTGRAGTAEALATGRRDVGVAWMTPVGETLYALRQGTLVKSTDAETFVEVTPTSTFTELGGVDDTLIALKRKSFGVAEVFISRDGGATWTQLADIDAGFTVGTGDSRLISRGLEGKLVLSMNVLDDSLGNVNYASQDYEFTAATATLKLISSTKDKLVAPPRPDYVSKTGLAFFTDDDTIDQQADATNVKVVLNPPASPELKTARRLRWTRPRLPFDASSSVVVLGEDSDGRLLIAAERIYRSKAPLKADDERALVLKGPLCDTRHSFVPDLENDDSVKVTFENRTGQRVLLRQLDNQLRWQRLQELDDGEKVEIRSLSNNASKQNVRLMVSDAEEICLGVYVVPSADESTIVASKP